VLGPTTAVAEAKAARAERVAIRLKICIMMAFEEFDAKL
jgi:hypothetical protein